MRLAILAASALSLAAADFRAGIARVDITPPIGHAMGGYSDRKGNAAGTHSTHIAEDVLFLVKGVDVRHHAEARR
jgi:hypothetical protein